MGVMGMKRYGRIHLSDRYQMVNEGLYHYNGKIMEIHDWDMEGGYIIIPERKHRFYIREHEYTPLSEFEHGIRAILSEDDPQ